MSESVLLSVCGFAGALFGRRYRRGLAGAQDAKGRVWLDSLGLACSPARPILAGNQTAKPLGEAESQLGLAPCFAHVPMVLTCGQSSEQTATASTATAWLYRILVDAQTAQDEEHPLRCPMPATLRLLFLPRPRLLVPSPAPRACKGTRGTPRAAAPNPSSIIIIPSAWRLRSSAEKHAELCPPPLCGCPSRRELQRDASLRLADAVLFLIVWLTPTGCRSSIESRHLRCAVPPQIKKKLPPTWRRH
ncbi:hypothetical protein HDV57DRAFT_80491 [Trichoderma longibrachiatum]